MLAHHTTMICVVASIGAGIATGALLHTHKRFIKSADRLTMWTIYLFLFLLGLNVGVKDEIMSNLGRLGFEALLLTAGALAGSIACSWILYRHFFRIPGNNEK